MARRKPRKKSLLNRGVRLIRGVRGRVRREARRAWRVSGLKVELAAARRQKAEAVRSLGEEIHRRIMGGALRMDDLKPMSDAATELDSKIAGLEKEITRLAPQAPPRRAASANKAPIESRRLELMPRPVEAGRKARRPPKEPLPSAPKKIRKARPLPVDPLEDILGAFEDDEAGGEGDGQRDRRTK